MEQLLGVVVPSYNEAESIGALIEALRKAAPSARVVVVDDSKSPDTADIVRAFEDPLVEVIHRAEKGGRGSAVLVGMEHLLRSRCSEIIEMDADFSHPPSQIPEILDFSRRERLDLTIASRYLPQSRILNWPLSRRLFSKASNFLARTLLGVPIHDYTNGYRYYSRRAAELITRTCGRHGKGFIALSEILVNVYYSQLGPERMRVGELPTTFVNRVRGESSVNSAEISNAFLGLFKIYRLKRKLQKELR